MFEKFIRDRITDLRLLKGVSEYQMSLDLGHVRSITSGRTLPSLTELPYICEYLGVSVKDFFDESAPNPTLIREMVLRAEKMDAEDLTAIIGVMERMKPFRN